MASARQIGANRRNAQKSTGPKTPEGKAMEPKKRSGIGLGTLPAERFVALHPADSGGAAVLETKPMTFAGEDLLVNADLGADPGQMCVEVLDAGGGEIAGCAADDCRLITHDKLRHRAVWAEGGQMRSLKQVSGGKPVVLRFTWTGGRFFAFQVVE